MCALVDERHGVGHRIVGCQRHWGVEHQVPAFDERHRLLYRRDRQILRQDYDATAAGDRLGHPPPGYRGHIGDHYRNGGARAVGGGQIDVEARRDLGSVRNDEHVVVCQVVPGWVPV